MKFLDILSWNNKEYFSKKGAEKIYNNLALENKYDTNVNYDNRVNRLSAFFKVLGGKYSNILDIACGTGATIDALKWKNEAKIVGIDISEEMLKTARKRFFGYENITFDKKDFLNLNYPINSFDLVTISYATRFINKEKEKDFAKQVNKILKPNGKFVVITNGLFMNSSLFLQKYLNISPKNYNLKMNYSKYIIKNFSNNLIFEKEFKLQNRCFFNKEIALVFTKK